MWGYLKTLYNRMPASFNQLTFEQLPRRYSDCLASNIFYTPKIQNIAFTQQLTKYLRYLQRKDKITSTDLRSLVEAMITQYGAVHGLENHPKFKANLSYSITRNYQFKENELSPFYGRVDYMIWLNSQHFVPVIFSQQSINPIAGIAAAHATRALKSMARNDLRQSGYSIITTGQQWQMFKIYNTQRCQKTIIYEGRNRFKNIIEDYQLISAMLGLVDECLQTERQEVNVLKLAYEVIDEGKHMLQASDAQQASKAAPVSRYLRKYYQKKKENTSK